MRRSTERPAQTARFGRSVGGHTKYRGHPEKTAVCYPASYLWRIIVRSNLRARDGLRRRSQPARGLLVAIFGVYRPSEELTTCRCPGSGERMGSLAACFSRSWRLRSSSAQQPPRPSGELLGTRRTSSAARRRLGGAIHQGDRSEPGCSPFYDDILSLSTKTTFDAVTHALMTTPLTDASGQKFGDGLALIERVDTVKGEVSGSVGRSPVSDVRAIDTERARDAGSLAGVQARYRQLHLPQGLSGQLPRTAEARRRFRSRLRWTAVRQISTSTIDRRCFPSCCSTDT